MVFALAANLFFSCSDGSDDSGGNTPGASLPKSEGENPFKSSASSDAKITLTTKTINGKIELDTKNNTGVMSNSKGEKLRNLRYTWNADEKEIYFAWTALYVGEKAYSNFNSYFDAFWNALLERVKMAWQFQGSPSTFEKWFVEVWYDAPTGTSLSTVKKELREQSQPIVTGMLSEKAIFSYTENGKLTLTEKFDYNFFGKHGYFKETNLNNNWSVGDEDNIGFQQLHYDAPNSYDDYYWQISSHDDKSITYTLLKDADSRGKNLPKKITVNYTYTPAATYYESPKLTLSFTDPINDTKVEGDVLYSPAVWQEQ